MSAKQLQTEILEKSYSDKIKPFFELDKVNIHYNNARLDYIEKFDIGQESIEELIELACDRSDEELDYDEYTKEIDRFFNATLHAVYALAQLQALEAVEPVLGRMYEEQSNDFLNEAIPEFLGKMGEGVVPLIKEHLTIRHENKLFLFEGIDQIIKNYPHTEDELTEILIDYIQFSSDDGTHLAFAISSMVDFSAAKHIEFIRDMFKRREIDYAVMGDIETIEISLGLRPKRGTAQPGFLGRSSQTETISNEAKVGRNDPCPCGSGKKYKKCCINK